MSDTGQEPWHVGDEVMAGGIKQTIVALLATQGEMKASLSHSSGLVDASLLTPYSLFETVAVDLPPLKPCPFCGSDQIDRYGVAIGVPEPIKRGPACDDCGASTQITGDASIDANLWNTRV